MFFSFAAAEEVNASGSGSSSSSSSSGGAFTMKLSDHIKNNPFAKMIDTPSFGNSSRTILRQSRLQFAAPSVSSLGLMASAPAVAPTKESLFSSSLVNVPTVNRNAIQCKPDPISPCILAVFESLINFVSLFAQTQYQMRCAASVHPCRRQPFRINRVNMESVRVNRVANSFRNR